MLRLLLPPGLELETAGGHGFVAVALVRTEALRPAGHAGRARTGLLPRRLSRVHDASRRRTGRRLRGLRILRSDANRARMVARREPAHALQLPPLHARRVASGGRIRFDVETRGSRRRPAADRRSRESGAARGLARSRRCREARRFAGPLPFTFDFEAETHAIIAIQARRARTGGLTPVAVDVERLSFFDQPAFHGCAPVLAAAFHVSDIDYRWERGVHMLARARPRRRCSH